jgi:hypothetical protein
MGVDKNFVVKNGLEVSENLIYADADAQKVGIGTTSLEYALEVIGDVSFTGQLLTPPEVSAVGSVSGIASATSPQFITGINTSSFRVYDLVDDGVGGIIETGTKVVSIGINNIQIDPSHTRTSGSGSVNLTVTRSKYSGNKDDILVSGGPGSSPVWKPLTRPIVSTSSTSSVNYPVFASGAGTTVVNINTNKLSFNPSSGNFGINTSNPKVTLDVDGDAIFTGVVTATTFNGIASTSINVIGGIGSVTQLTVSGIATVGFVSATNVSVAQTVIANTVDALTYFGSGQALSGIVTQITAGIGVRLSPTELPGKGVVTVDSYFPIGKTIFVTQNGNDSNSGLTESDSKRTIKAAAAIAFPGDTIKVFPGVYVEENPIYLSKRVAVEGTELRNCVVTPKYTDRDLFYVNNSCHITDLSFIGPEMTNGASIVTFQPLAGVATDRFFDAARMIRYNLDFIASETVGYLTSTDYKSPAFVIPTGNPTDCSDDIKDVMKSVIHDITRGGNLKCVGAGKSSSYHRNRYKWI